MVFTWMNFAVLLFPLGGLLFAAGPLIGACLLAPKADPTALGRPYECGIPVRGRQAWVRFGLTFYLYALLFIAFDVDVLYLFPVAAVYRDTSGWLPWLQVMIFLAVLFAVLFYFASKGVFSWPKRIRVSNPR